MSKPWLGARPYLEADASLFFGRDAEIGIVAEALKTTRLTLLSGARGAGKTSLLRAGVVPRLREAAADNRGARVIVIADAWQGDPLQNLIEQIQSRCAEALPIYDPIRVPRVRPLERVVEHWSMHAELWIILDHFEDYLSAHPNENSEGTLAVELPRIIRRADLRANVLIAMCGEAHAKLGRLAQRLPQLFDRSLRLKLLSLEAARQAIVSPIAVWNRAHPEMPPVVIAPGLIDAVLKNLVANAEAATPPPGTQTLIDPRVLQHSLLELWDKRINPDAVRSPSAALHANSDTVAAAAPVRPISPAMAGAVPPTRKLPTAPMPVKQPPDSGHDRARGRRSFVTLAFLFLVTFAVFGAGAWVLQVGRDTQDESVQQAADKALERARETIAKARARQAERERRIAENGNSPAPEPASAPPMQSENTRIDGPQQAGDSEIATPSPSYVPPPPIEAVGITPPPSRHAEPRLTANARDDRTHRAPSPPAPLSRSPKPAAPTPEQAPTTPAPLTTATASLSLVVPPVPTTAPQLTPPLPSTAPEAAGTSSAPGEATTAGAASAVTSDVPDEAPVAPSTPQPDPSSPPGADPVQGTVGPESVPASDQATPNAPTAVKTAPASAGRRVAVTESTRAAARPKQEKKPQSASSAVPAVAAQSSPSGGFITSARALAPSHSAAALRSGESTELFVDQNGKKAPVHTAAYTIKPGGASPPAIFIHVRDNVQLVHTLRLKRQLEAKGVVVSGIKTVSNGPSDADLRYFRSSEREEARRMVNILQSLNVPIEQPKYIAGFESSATTRQYELWFPSN